MIFVITGTEAFPFDRLIKEIDMIKNNGIIRDEVFIQLGSCNYEPEYCRWKKWLSFGEMCEHIRNASEVIAHAGAGTTLLCLELDKTPILVTRKKAFGEHLDDHQVPFAQMMEKLNYVIAVYDAGDLKKIFKNPSVKNSTRKLKKDNSMLVNYLNSWINDE